MVTTCLFLLLSEYCWGKDDPQKRKTDAKSIGYQNSDDPNTTKMDLNAADIDAPPEYSPSQTILPPVPPEYSSDEIFFEESPPYSENNKK